jgi:hypothetical protein
VPYKRGACLLLGFIAYYGSLRLGPSRDASELAFLQNTVARTEEFLCNEIRNDFVIAFSGTSWDEWVVLEARQGYLRRSMHASGPGPDLFFLHGPRF